MNERRAKIFSAYVRAYQHRLELQASLLALDTLWRNLGIAGALCTAHSAGWTDCLEAVRCERLPTHWYPGCGRSSP